MHNSQLDYQKIFWAVFLSQEHHIYCKLQWSASPCSRIWFYLVKVCKNWKKTSLTDTAKKCWPKTKHHSYFVICSSANVSLFPCDLTTSEISACSKHTRCIHISPPASPVYVPKGPQHHSLPCVHPASRPNEPCVYLLRLLGKEGVWSLSNHVPIEGSWVKGNMGQTRCVQLSAFENFTGEQKTTTCHSYLEAVRLDF